jgi:hypothetical protein
MNRRFSRSPSYYAPRLFLGAVKAVTLIKQGVLMNWRRYREALLLTGERPGIRVVRLIHRDSVWMNLYRQTISDAWLMRSLRVSQPYRPARLSLIVLLLQQLNSVSIVLKRHGRCCPALSWYGLQAPTSLGRSQ